MGRSNVKPVLTLVEGELKLSGPARSYKKGLDRVEKEIAGLGTPERLGIVHAHRPELANDFAQILADRMGFPREGIFVAELCTALASHGGEGALAAVAVSEGG
ncbi:MAG: DegV family protein [Anaerolineae bacterium]